MSSPDKPAAVLNLDTLETKGESQPFPVNHGGKLYHLTHLDDLDGWEFVDAQQSGSDAAVLKLALGEKYDEFRKTPLPKKKLDTLVRRYLTHCGIDLGNSDS